MTPLAKTKEQVGNQETLKVVPCLLSARDLEEKIEEQFGATRAGITRRGVDNTRD